MALARSIYKYLRVFERGGYRIDGWIEDPEKIYLLIEFDAKTKDFPERPCDFSIEAKLIDDTDTSALTYISQGATLVLCALLQTKHRPRHCLKFYELSDMSGVRSMRITDSIRGGIAEVNEFYVRHSIRYGVLEDQPWF